MGVHFRRADDAQFVCIIQLSSTLESPLRSEFGRVQSRQQLECRIATANRDCMKQLLCVKVTILLAVNPR